MTRPVERAVATTLDRKMARRGAVTHDPPVLDDVAERLRGFLGARVEGDFRRSEEHTSNSSHSGESRMPSSA